MMMRVLHWVLFGIFVIGGGSTPFFASAHSLDTVMDQMRWPFERGEVSGYAEIESLIQTRQPEDLKNAYDLLQQRIAAFQGNPLEVITRDGVVSGEAGVRLRAVREVAYDNALLWLLTGRQEYATRAKEIMLRLAEVIPHWPLYDRAGKAQRQDSSKYLRDAEANGLWRRWHPLDLSYSIPMLRAYDILRPVLSVQEKETLEKGLFLYHKQLIDKFDGLKPLYHNLSGYHLIPLIQFGWVLERPDFIHEAVEYWDEMLRYAYGADGFYKEVTPDYHQQISSRLVRTIPAMLKGYENLDLAATYAPRLQQVDAAVRLLLMPDGKYANFNDSWPKNMPRDPQPSDEPGLLGTSGVAKLGSSNMVAFLKYHGIRGHDHRDGLGLVWFAGGKEVFSDTGYRAREELGIEFERSWSASTASHLTAAVNKTIQFSERSPVTIPERTRGGFAANPPATPGMYAVEAALPAAARFANQGKLSIWDATRRDVQAMEADQENAYPGTASLFRRSLIMVPLDEAKGEGYLVDIFRIRGGATHDYFLRGGLDHEYTLDADLEWQIAEEGEKPLYQFITPKRRAKITEGASVVAEYTDGLRVISHLFGVDAERENLELIIGEADAIRRPGKAPFAIVRSTASQGESAIQTVFPWVHEVTSGEPRIQGISIWKAGLDVILLIHLRDRIDIIISGEYDESDFKMDGWDFVGKLAYGRMTSTPDQIEWTVFEGQELVYQDGKKAPIKPVVRGKVVSTTMRDEGAELDSLWITPNKSGITPQEYHVAHVDFGHGVRQSYPVERVEVDEESGQWRVVLGYNPGFVVEGDHSRMTRYPGWRIQGQPQVRLR